MRLTILASAMTKRATSVSILASAITKRAMSVSILATVVTKLAMSVSILASVITKRAMCINLLATMLTQFAIRRCYIKVLNVHFLILLYSRLLVPNILLTSSFTALAIVTKALGAV